MCRVTTLERIINVKIRGTTKVGEIAKKVQEKKVQGRVKRRWLDRVSEAIKRRDGRGGGVYDRATWRRISSNIDPNKSGNKMKTNTSVTWPCVHFLPLPTSPIRESTTLDSDNRVSTAVKIFSLEQIEEQKRQCKFHTAKKNAMNCFHRA